MSEKLKPCPFCKGKGWVWMYGFNCAGRVVKHVPIPCACQYPPWNWEKKDA